MKACVIIPARYKSTRLPGKPLIKLLGKPMILWVAEIAAISVGIDNVYVATDDIRICEVVEKAGYKNIMTSEKALTGTDRVAEASIKLNYDIFVNVQGDEPLIHPEDINECIRSKYNHYTYVINSFNRIEEGQDAKNINIPKVITNESNELVYISRALIPGIKDQRKFNRDFKKQVCIYGYNREELTKFVDFGRKSKLEEIEDIEIIRFFELGIPIKMFAAQNASLSVDVIHDIPLVEEALKKRSSL